MFWDKVACVYDVFANVINRKANRALCETVAALIRPADTVLECACGTGLLTGVIAPRCKSLTATDFSANMLKRAEKKLKKYGNVRFAQADITKLDYRTAASTRWWPPTSSTCWMSRTGRWRSLTGSASRAAGSSSPPI